MTSRRIRTVLTYSLLALIACKVTGERTYGGPQNQNATSIRPTADGGAIIAGYTAYGTAGGTDAYLLKLADDGDVQWSLTYGGAGFDRGADVVPAAGGGYFFALATESEGPGDPENYGSYRNVQLLKVDDSGAIAWERLYGEVLSDGVAGMAGTPDGGVVLAGFTHNAVDGPAALVLRYSAGGELLWVTKLEDELPNTVASSVAVVSDGGIVIAGSTMPDGEKNDGFVAKLDDTGAILWAYAFGDELSEQFQAVRATRDGGVIAAGYRSDWWPELRNTDGIVVKYDANGLPQWEGTYGGDNNDEATSIVEVDDGYVLIGSTNSYGEATVYSSDIWVAKLSLGGTLQWNRAYGGGGNNYGTDIRALDDGRLLVVGDTFPELSLINAYDMWVARLDRDGQLD